MSRETQALCYFAGANSIFYGDKLLTTANPRAKEDLELLRELGLAPASTEPSDGSPRSRCFAPADANVWLTRRVRLITGTTRAVSSPRTRV